MFKKNKLLSIVLMSVFGLNGANNISNANEVASEVNPQRQTISTENKQPVKVKFNSEKAVRIGINSMKIIFGLAGVGLPISSIIYDIRKDKKKSEKNLLKKIIENYEAVCPSIKKLYNELNSALVLKKNIENYNETDPRFAGIRSKITTAEANWNNQTGVPAIEKLATIRYGEKKLDLRQAHELLEKLEQESADLSNTSNKIGFANNIYRIVEPIVR